MNLAARVRHNLGLKMISLAVALAIWGAVHNQTDPLVLRHRAVPVEASGVPTNLAVARIEPSQVTVTLYGRTSRFEQLEYSNFRLVADVTHGQVGTQTMPVSPDGLPEGLEIRSIARAMVRVELDSVVTARRQVFVQTHGDPASGFAAASSSVEPSQVSVSGPSSQVQRVARVVAEVDISGRNAALPTTVTLAAQDAGSLPLSGVRIEPAQAVVTVTLRQVNSKTVPVVPVILSVPAGYEVGRLTVKPVTVTLTGPANVLTAVDSVQTGPISLRDTREGGTFTAPIRLPDGASTTGAASATVTVRMRRMDPRQGLELQPVTPGAPPQAPPEASEEPEDTAPPPAATPAHEPSEPATTTPPASERPRTPAHGRPPAESTRPSHPAPGQGEP